MKILNKYNNTKELIINFNKEDLNNITEYYNSKTRKELKAEHNQILNTIYIFDEYKEELFKNSREEYLKLNKKRFITFNILQYIKMNIMIIREDLKNTNKNKYKEVLNIMKYNKDRLKQRLQ